MSEEQKMLELELGGPLPDGFKLLPAEQLRWLADTLRQTKVTQLEELDRSTEESINNLPVMLRGPVRAIVGGKKQ